MFGSKASGGNASGLTSSGMGRPPSGRWAKGDVCRGEWGGKLRTPHRRHKARKGYSPHGEGSDSTRTDGHQTALLAPPKLRRPIRIGLVDVAIIRPSESG